ncbi:MAG: WYL domain-containing protein, partial [bacterium]|nr:WYL domain-containing protein [bacterium]
VAWDLDREDWRTFRLDRIDDPRSTNRRFAPRPLPAPDPTTYLRQTIATLRSVYNVELIVDTPIAAVQRHMGSARFLDRMLQLVSRGVVDWPLFVVGMVGFGSGGLALLSRRRRRGSWRVCSSVGTGGSRCVP